MPLNWRMSKILFFYKGKGAARCCGNYRSVKLMEHEIKFMEIIFKKQLKNQVEIAEMQMGFIPGKDTIEAIFW